MTIDRGHTLLWLDRRASDVPAGCAWLSARECEALSRLRFTRRRASWRLGRWTAKLAVAAALRLDVPPEEVEIVAAGDGAPEAFVAGARAPVRVAISHSGERSMCAVVPARIRVGCDVETIESRAAAFALDYFAPGEVEWAHERSGDERAIRETLVWSAKESALKTLRDGLRRDTRDVVVDPRSTPRVGEWEPVKLAMAGAAPRLYGWWRHDGACAYALVTDGPCAEPTQPAPDM